MDIKEVNRFLGKSITRFECDEIHDLTVNFEEADNRDVQSASKRLMECLDCGHTFRRKMLTTHEIKCPQCWGFDIEIGRRR